MKVINIMPRKKGSIFHEGKKCSVRGCLKKPKYVFFGGDGLHMLSRLVTETCSTHIEWGINKTKKYNNEN